MSKSDPVNERFDIGLVGAPHGIRGEVRVKVLSDVPGRMEHLREAYLISADRKTERLVRLKTRPGKGTCLIKIEGVEDRDQAQALRGYYISLSRSQALPLPQGRYFVRDLVGLEVVDETLGVVGTLKDVFTEGVQDLYLVQRKGKKDFLFPAVPQFLKEIDLSAGRILVALPNGLLDIYE